MSNRKTVVQFNAFDVLDQGDEDADTDAWEVVAKKTTAARKAAGTSEGKSAAGIKNRAGPASHTAADALTGAYGKQNSAARVDDYYRAFQHLYRDPATNDVILRFHKTNVVRIRPNGEVVLTAGGWYTYTTLAAINDAMQAMNMRVLHHGQPAAGAWLVKDDQGRQLPFQDGMVLQPTRAEHRNRAETVLRTYHGGAEVPRYAHRQLQVPQQQQQQQPQQQSQSHQQGQAAPAGTVQPRLAATSLHQAAAGHVVAGNESSAASNSVAKGPALQQQQRQQQLSPVQHPAALLKPAHQQLAEAVQQLGMEDEIHCEDDHLCVVCLEHPRDEILVPCGHMVLCQQCCQSVMDSSNECPVCRETITDHCTLDSHHQ